MLGGKKVLQARVYDLTVRKRESEELMNYRDHLAELVSERTTELEKRIKEVERLNFETVGLSEGLQLSNKNLKAITGQLTLANKELGAFAYSVSHDLRAPLRSIDGFSKLLLEDYSDVLDEQGQHFLRRVRSGTQNMGRLIDDILSLSRSGRHVMVKKTINIETVVKEIYNLFERELQDRKVNFIVYECPSVLADCHLVKIAVTNLLSNALKFTRTCKNAKIEVGSITEDGNTVFFIKDNGVGFDMKYADKLFVAFHRLHSSEAVSYTHLTLPTILRV